jgi:hypothetical protein
MTTCGPGLWACRCNGHRAPLRTQAEVNALHREAVARAIARGAGNAPVPAHVLDALLPRAA